MRLGLKLLQERAKVGSFWWPYISNLQETYNVPIFFPGEAVKNLQYSPLLYQVNKRCRFLLDFVKEVKCVLENLKADDHPFGGQDVDASSLGWAMSAVSSRAFCLYGRKLQDGSHICVPMMLPLVDMCNHSFNPDAEIVQEQGNENAKTLVKVVARTEIKQDDPLALNYGCLNNDLFLLDYGFVIHHNYLSNLLFCNMKLERQLDGTNQVAVLIHNDRLYLFQEILGLAFEELAVDLAPRFQLMAEEIFCDKFNLSFIT